LGNLSLILIESTSHLAAIIFSDSRSVLDALSSSLFKSCNNYLIPLIRDKYSLVQGGISIRFAWIPSHLGIPGNERVDSFAKQAALFGRKPKFKVPFPDFFSRSQRSLRDRSRAFLDNAFLTKGVYYFTNFFQSPPPLKPWFSHLPISREQAITVTRLRSNHYNLNYSLYRKNIVASSACECGDPRQDINHVIFRCPLTGSKSTKLRFFLSHHVSPPIQDLSPFLKNPSPKLCRLITSFLKSRNLRV